MTSTLKNDNEAYLMLLKFSGAPLTGGHLGHVPQVPQPKAGPEWCRDAIERAIVTSDYWESVLVFLETVKNAIF